MGESDPRNTEQVVEEYVGIIQQFGPSSDEATEYRQANPRIRELEDIDAAYVAVQYDDARIWVRRTIYGVVCVLLVAITCLGIWYGDYAREKGDEVLVARSDNAANESVIVAAREQLSDSSGRKPGASIAPGETVDGYVDLPTPVDEATRVVVKISDSTARVLVDGEERSEIVVPAGQSRAAFQIQANNVEEARTAMIGVSRGTVTPNAVRVLPAVFVESVTVTPAAVVGGDSATGEILLNREAVGDISVELIGDSDAMISGGANKWTHARIRAGARSGLFPIKTNRVFTERTAVIVVRSGGVEQHAELRILPPLLGAFEQSSAMVTTKSPATVAIRLARQVSAVGGATLQLQCADPAVRFLVGDAPVNQVRIRVGEAVATFRVAVTEVTAPRVVQVIARIGDETIRTKMLAAPEGVKLKKLGALSGIPPVVIAGESVEATLEVALDDADTPAFIKLNSNNPRVSFLVGEVPSDQLLVAAGETTVRFRVQTQAVNEPEAAVISIRHGDEKKELPLVLQTPDQALQIIQSFEFASDFVLGGHSLQAVLKLKQPLDQIDAAEFTINSDVPVAIPSKNGQATSTFQIQPQASEANIEIKTTTVSEPTLARVSVNYEGESRQAVFVVLPKEQSTSLVDRFTIAPERFVGGRSARATLKLTHAVVESEDRMIYVEADLPGVTFFTAGRRFTSAMIRTGASEIQFRIETPCVFEPTLARVAVKHGGNNSQQALLLLPACSPEIVVYSLE